MKQLVTALTMTIIFSGSAMAAQELSDSNLVKRTLTLKDSEVFVGGGIQYGKDQADDHELRVGVALGYGITDNVSIGLSGIRYRFIERDESELGLEMAVNFGLKGQYSSALYGDALGYGSSVFGKYVLSSDTAVNFGASYIFWNEERLENKKEWDYSVGVTQNITSDIAVIATMTYRDLSGFTQKSAINSSLRLNYALSDKMELGTILAYTDFDASKNQYDGDNVAEKSLGMYLNYRF